MSETLAMCTLHQAMHQASFGPDARDFYAERDSFIMRHRDLGWTYAQIGAAFNLSIERMRQIVLRVRAASRSEVS